MAWLINSEQTLSAVRKAGVDEEELKLSWVAVLTFSKAVVDHMEELCGLESVTWIGPRHHPYAAPELVMRGSYRGLGVNVLVPPMGASPLACILEDLATCGVRCVFLVCAAWSLGPPVHFGDLIVPAFSIGHDGTSIHYGNTSDHVQADATLVDSLAMACRKVGALTHIGGNASCEALYRITPEMADHFRERGCLCMDNGEASTLLAVAKIRGILGGVLFQPYIELSQGWSPARLDERYRAACRLQAEAVLDTSIRVKQKTEQILEPSV